MKIRVIVALLAAAVAAGYVSDSLSRRSGRASFCAAPLVAATGDRSAPAKPAPKKAPRKAQKPAPRPSTAVARAQRRLIVYYFHGNYRCASCRKIESWTAEVLRSGFANEIKANRLVWRVVNVDTKGNEHYMKDYKLYTKSVVLSDTKDGKEIRWTNLGLVWSYLGDEARFKEYVRDGVSAYVKET